MNIHEFQAKKLLTQYGANIPPGGVAQSVEQAEHVAREIGGSLWVVKAQIHAGDRGQVGGIRQARSVAEVGKVAGSLLGSNLVTPQTGPAGRTVHQVYVEQACDIQHEFYLGMLVDRDSAQVAILASAGGGSGIEQVATRRPEEIRKDLIEWDTGLSTAHALQITSELGVPAAAQDSAVELLVGMYRAFLELDASLIEINPLVVTATGELPVLDVKMSFDDNALFRHPEIEELRDPAEEEPDRLERARHGFNYVHLGGNIGCLVTGAGLALATADLIELHGGAPANFLDLPPVAKRTQVAEALKHILSDRAVAAVLVNAVGGGMTRCDVVAEGIITAAQEVNIQVPLVIRLSGTSKEAALMLLRNSRLEFTAAVGLTDAVQSAIKAAEGNR